MLEIDEKKTEDYNQENEWLVATYHLLEIFFVQFEQTNY